MILHYPSMLEYWITYGSPEDPDEGKKAMVIRLSSESEWQPTMTSTPSVGVFQFPTSTWTI